METGTEMEIKGCNPRLTLIIIGMLILLLGGVWFMAQPPSEAQKHETRLAIERADALQPWDIALGIAWRVVAIGAGLVFLAGLAGATRAAVGLLADRRRTIRPQDGMFPARVLRPGESLADLNRAPDGKVQTVPVGWRSALLLRLLFGKKAEEQLGRPGVTVLPHDTSPEQLRITSQAQVVQALAAAPTGYPGAAQSPMAQPLLIRPTQQLPPMVTLDQAPEEVRLLVEAGQHNWDRRGEDSNQLLVIDQPE